MKQPKTEVPRVPFSFRLTESEAERIRDLADAELRTMQSYLRLVVVNHIQETDAAQEAC